MTPMSFANPDQRRPPSSSTSSPSSSRKNCIHFLRTGKCGYGDKCKYYHAVASGAPTAYTHNINNNLFPNPQAYMGLQQPIFNPSTSSEIRHNSSASEETDCKFYVRTGLCKYGAHCKYRHPPVVVQLNLAGLPIRLGEKECGYYVRTGLCKFGLACKFHHPEPCELGPLLPTVTPPPAPPVFYAPALAPTPSSLWPSCSRTQSNYLPVSPCFPIPSSPCISTDQAHSPPSIILNGIHHPIYQNPGIQLPSDGELHSFVYGTEQKYAGVEEGVRIAPSSSMLGDSHSTPSNASQSLAAMAPSHLPLMSTFLDLSLTSLPQRPGEPDCSFYVKTGLCKFGVHCRYHHPKDPTASLVSTKLSPMGLPLRPGVALCAFYLKNGICKFGPLCKFDHPFDILPTAMAISRKLGSSTVVEAAISHAMESHDMQNGSCRSTAQSNDLESTESRIEKGMLSS